MNILDGFDTLTEMKCGNNFAYIVNDGSVFLPTEYKVLQNQTDDLFVKCMKMRCNGKVQLYYLTDSYRSLADMTPLFDEVNMATIVMHLLSGIIEVRKNGFLSCQSLDIATDHIFVEPATNRIRLVYVPTEKRLFCDVAAFENGLRANLIKLIRSTPDLRSPKIKQLEADLTDAVLPLENIYLRLKGNHSSVNTESRGVGKSNHSSSGMKLIATNAPVLFEISVTKDEFILGKKQEAVDGAITFNRMISRLHCKIVRRGNEYSVIDLKSANGTYLNGIRLQADQPNVLRDGDQLRLANSEFRVAIE